MMVITPVSIFTLCVLSSIYGGAAVEYRDYGFSKEKYLVVEQKLAKSPYDFSRRWEAVQVAWGYSWMDEDEVAVKMYLDCMKKEWVLNHG